LKATWHGLNRRNDGRYFGFVIDDQKDPMSNLRFADDVLLFSQNKQDAAKMLGHLQTAAARYGLRINFDKTKVLTNVQSVAGGFMFDGGSQVEIIPPGGSEKYLGRVINLQSFGTPYAQGNVLYQRD
jgi:hypothetical protein